MSKIKNGGLDQYAKCKAFNGIGGERVKNAMVSSLICSAHFMFSTTRRPENSVVVVCIGL